MFSYPPDLPAPTTGHLMHWEHSNFFRLNVHLDFKEHPDQCWALTEKLLAYASPPKHGKEVEWDGNG